MKPQTKFNTCKSILEKSLRCFSFTQILKKPDSSRQKGVPMAQTGGQRIATLSRTVSQFELRSRFGRQFLTFAGKSSKDFLLYLSGPGVFNSPEPDVSATEVPGRNGDVLSENAKDGRRRPSQSSPGFSQLLAINACRTPTTRSSSGWQPVSRRLNLTCRITAGQRRWS